MHEVEIGVAPLEAAEPSATSGEAPPEVLASAPVQAFLREVTSKALRKASSYRDVPLDVAITIATEVAEKVRDRCIANGSYASEPKRCFALAIICAGRLAERYLRDSARQMAREFVYMEEHNDTVHAEYNPDLNLEAKELTRIIGWALAQLPRKRRLVYVLYRNKGLTYEDIARVLGMSPKTVSDHLVKARAWMEKVGEEYRRDGTIPPAPRGRGRRKESAP